ncbi:MAG: sensor histidine kinase [Pirellulaceae bacterium]
MNEPPQPTVPSSGAPQAEQAPQTSDSALLAEAIAQLENDRRLIGFEIHDGVVQGIVASIMQLEAMSPHLPKPQRVKIAQVIEMLRGSVAEARRIMQGLSPAPLEETGLIAAIEELVAQQGPDRCAIRFRHDVIARPISLLLQSAVLRIVQEGISNINRHSQASIAEILLTSTDDCLLLSVVDNGIGFDPQEKSSGGFGLRGITERARQFGVRPNIISAPGAGTIVEVDLPFIPPDPNAISDTNPSASIPRDSVPD